MNTPDHEQAACKAHAANGCRLTSPDVPPAAYPLHDYRAEALAAIGAACAAFAWFLIRLSPPVAFGPWQGLLLDPLPIPDLPILSRWVARAVLAASEGQPAKAAFWLNVMSAVFGALSCGMLALTAAGICRQIASRRESFMCGTLAGIFLALTPSVTYAATAAAPTTLSLFLALASMACLALRMEARSKAIFLFMSALCAGLAAANHPTFAWLLLLVLLAAAFGPALGYAFSSILFVALPAFLLGALIPVAVSRIAGESMREFLAHALQTPYPALGEGAPRLGFGTDLLLGLPVAPLVFAWIAFIVALRRPTRSSAFAWAAVFLVMGPFAPALTNQYGHGIGITDPIAPFCLVLAGVCVFLGCGGALLLSLVSRKSECGFLRGAAVAVLPILVYTLGVVPGVPLASARVAPDRNHTRALELGKQILADCPLNALLVSGDPALTSLVRATQLVAQYRADVTIVASEWLVVPRFRQRLIGRSDDATRLTRDFPVPAMWVRWEKEQPLLVKQFLDHPSADECTRYAELALWDLVRDNSPRRAVCFIGLRSQWLMARAMPSGATVTYPESETPASPALAAILDSVKADSALNDPGLAEAVTALLLPLSENARLQDNLPEASRLARIAAALAPAEPAAWLAVARAAARDGQREAALAAASTCIELLQDSEQGDTTSVKDLIAADLERREAAFRFAHLDTESDGNDPERNELAAKLWQADELVVLEKSYAAMSLAQPRDVDALYQRAAVLTQLGRLVVARETLARAIEAAPTEIASRILNDGRFTLLRESGDERSPASGDSAPGVSNSSSTFVDACVTDYSDWPEFL